MSQQSRTTAREVFYCESRTKNSAPVFDAVDRAALESWIDKSASFCGIEVMESCVLANRFLLLLKIHKKRWITTDELEERMFCIYSPDNVKRKLSAIRYRAAMGEKGAASSMRRKITERMYSLPDLMKLIKKNYTHHFNARHSHRGPIWTQGFFRRRLPSRDAINTMREYISCAPEEAVIAIPPEKRP